MSFTFRDVVRMVRELDLDAKQVRDALLLYRKMVIDKAASNEKDAVNDLFNHKQLKKLEGGTKH